MQSHKGTDVKYSNCHYLHYSFTNFAKTKYKITTFWFSITQSLFFCLSSLPKQERTEKPLQFIFSFSNIGCSLLIGKHWTEYIKGSNQVFILFTFLPISIVNIKLRLLVLGFWYLLDCIIMHYAPWKADEFGHLAVVFCFYFSLSLWKQIWIDLHYRGEV